MKMRDKIALLEEENAKLREQNTHLTASVQEKVIPALISCTEAVRASSELIRGLEYERKLAQEASRLTISAPKASISPEFEALLEQKVLKMLNLHQKD